MEGKMCECKNLFPEWSHQKADMPEIEKKIYSFPSIHLRCQFTYLIEFLSLLSHSIPRSFSASLSLSLVLLSAAHSLSIPLSLPHIHPHLLLSLYLNLNLLKVILSTKSYKFTRTHVLAKSNSLISKCTLE